MLLKLSKLSIESRRVFVILFLNQEVIVGVIYHFEVELRTKVNTRIDSLPRTHMLNSDQVRPNEGYVVQLAERAHNTAAVNARNQNGEKVI
jgi:hypothetical protein